MISGLGSKDLVLLLDLEILATAFNAWLYFSMGGFCKFRKARVVSRWSSFRIFGASQKLSHRRKKLKKKSIRRRETSLINDIWWRWGEGKSLEWWCHHSYWIKCRFILFTSLKRKVVETEILNLWFGLF